MGGVLQHLGATCCAAREAAGLFQSDIAASAGLPSRGKISRFETGAARRAPVDLDGIVAAYGRECGIDAYDLWLGALTAWRDERDKTATTKQGETK